jgi:tRNA uridine 5-carboxymethylaminomethyl modification enzyme
MRNVDVVVVGAGHAGIEAALAACRLGCEVALVTTSRDTIGHMPCNPAIGGTAKGHLVREIDALGGVMGLAIDATGIQFKLLNRSRGPAVWSPRAQADKQLYRQWVTDRLEAERGLGLFYDRVVDLQFGSAGVSVHLRDGSPLNCAAVVVTTGTFLNGLTHVGDFARPEGRFGEPPSVELANTLRRLQLDIGRLKTGTPPRLDRQSIDFDSQVDAGRFVEERGDASPVPFSFETRTPRLNRISCWSLYTVEETHDLVKRHIGSSPLYNGRITGVGPRYCPSLEDKVMRFPHRERHQLHLEPEGLDSESIYVNGLSMSLPAELQAAIVRSLPGLEGAKVIRPGYAVEYDFAQPTGLTHGLESRRAPGLFLAGQINGTSGYEEAAAQGLLAGINAARRARRRQPLILSRQESYIGILVDDLVTQGCLEPYRMFTSRAEYRLLLRIDNADQRLTPVGRRIGLVTDDRWAAFEERRARHARNEQCLRRTSVRLGENRMRAAKALKRPDVQLASLVQMGVVLDLPDGPDGLHARSLEAEVKYEGYLKQERAEVRRVKRQGARRIPVGFAFESIPGLSREVVERLTQRQPATLAEASRIPGVTPAALGVLNACLRQSTRHGGSSRVP